MSECDCVREDGGVDVGIDGAVDGLLDACAYGCEAVVCPEDLGVSGLLFLVWFGGWRRRDCLLLSEEQRSKWSWGIYIRTTLWSCVVEVGVENVDAKLAPSFGELTSMSCVSIGV